jgi:hypothetical protein
MDASDSKFTDNKSVLDLDEFGFPVVALANHLLIRQADFGESQEALENNWQTWLQHMPFDAPVARRLADIYKQRMAKLDPGKDAGALQRLTRKLHLADRRARRYAETAFGNN